MKLKMDELTRRIVDWMGELSYERLPQPVVHEVKRRIIDSIGVAMAAWDADSCRITREQATSVTASEGGATVWGTKHRTSPDLAAFANGTQVRYLDYNDTYLSL